MPEDDPVPTLLVGLAAWSWRILVVTAAAVLVGFVLLKLAVIVVPVTLALFLAAVLEPVAAWLREHGWHRALAAAAVFLGALGVLVAAVAWISTSVAGEFGEVGDQVTQGVAEIREWVQREFDIPPERLTQIENSVRDAFQTSGGGGLARNVVGGARVAAQVAGGMVLTLFTLFFLIKDGESMGAWILGRTPASYREDVRVAANASADVMRQYLKATAITGLIDAVLIGLALWAVGVPLVLPLSVLTFIGGFFPIIGAFVAGLFATLVALVSGGPADAIIVLGATVAVQQVEGNLLQPLILGPAVRLHSLITVLAVAAGLAVGGLLGAFLSVPLLAIAVRIGHFYRTRNLVLESAGRDPVPIARTMPTTPGPAEETNVPATPGAADETNVPATPALPPMPSEPVERAKPKERRRGLRAARRRNRR